MQIQPRATFQSNWLNHFFDVSTKNRFLRTVQFWFSKYLWFGFNFHHVGYFFSWTDRKARHTAISAAFYHVWLWASVDNHCTQLAWLQSKSLWGIFTYHQQKPLKSKVLQEKMYLSICTSQPPMRSQWRVGDWSNLRFNFPWQVLPIIIQTSPVPSLPIWPCLPLSVPVCSCPSGQLLLQNLCNSAKLPKKLQGPTANSAKE